MSIQNLSTALLLSSAIALSACGKKKPASVDLSALTIASLEAQTEIKSASIDESSAMTALSALRLSEDAGPFDWAAMSGSSGTYEYTDFAPDNGGFSADKMIVSGVTQGESPEFDRIEFQRLEMGSTLIESLVLANPVDGKSVPFIQGLLGDKPSVALMGEHFEAGIIQTYSFDIPEADMSGGGQTIAFGPSADGKNRDIIIEGMSLFFDMTEFEMQIDMGALKVTGASPKYLSIMVDTYAGVMPEGNSIYMHNYADEFEVLDLTMKFGEEVSVEMPRFYGTATQLKGGGYSSVSYFEKSKIILPPSDELTKIFGGNELSFFGETDQTVDVAKDRMTVDRFYLEFPENFNINFEIDLSGMIELQNSYAGKTMAEMMMADEMAFVPDIDLIRFSFEDSGLMDRVWKMAAEEQEQKPAMLKQQAKMGLMMLPAMAEDDSEKKLMTEMAEALDGFIDDGGTLIFEMKPEGGFDFSNLENMDTPEIRGELLDGMGLKFKHKK
ncbi:MAG: hypothetical protein HKN36_04625 [Hellea sp.]|nr:hypothetical protein [Hellea sp.]